MSYCQEKIEEFTHPIIHLLGEQLTWRWEDRFSAMLSEFSRDKKDKTLDALRQQFQHEWNKKTAKKAPQEIKEYLGPLIKLNKDQLILARPATDSTPAIIALWWPWGHGGTYSLRLAVLDSPYEYDESAQSDGKFLSRIKNMFS
ncbi:MULTISPECIES: hypothetical protein [unclassified Colwellia]|uniref:hypothetical protein n=1 Tax=unclassified Colwellia TaxID=196834 RepID=UPI0015F38FAB|nr:MULTISPECIES: hypothetical protein [unclassified Colwellia]MBA6377823.1 hypothetical protein [Colwellia sp. BRX10-7]MBA6387828.1 hypothetical protein [Colwellia sp. BRX10-2]MBA6400831.1 hypothetical protein [Colwellia sp. BRX10-5]MBA6404675.1 hypothetical protein [Colwellia sp. BRX10-1]